jgi:hypothetical protein
MEKDPLDSTVDDEAQSQHNAANTQEVLPDQRADRKQNYSFLQDVPIEEAPPPAYSESYGLVDMNQLGLNTRANVSSEIGASKL